MIACLALLWLAIYLCGPEGMRGTTQRPDKLNPHVSDLAGSLSVDAKGNHTLSPRQRANASNSKPETPDPNPIKVFTATVDAEIKAGETLVMGGYRTEGGNHEFTLLKPTLVTLQDGTQAIHVKPRALSIGSEFAFESGMDSLTTSAATADQNAEAWGQEDVRDTILSAYKAHGTRMMAAPTISVTPGEPFAISVGGEGGSAKYSIVATISANADGNFVIQSRTMRTAGGQP